MCMLGKKKTSGTDRTKPHVLESFCSNPGVTFLSAHCLRDYSSSFATCSAPGNPESPTKDARLQKSPITETQGQNTLKNLSDKASSLPPLFPTRVARKSMEMADHLLMVRWRKPPFSEHHK